MKKRIFSVAAVALVGTLLFSSCIGSFSLSKKVLAWNQTIDNKFVNEVVFVALWIVPVYEVCAIADILVINSIEFWSGSNPVQAGLVKEVKGGDGKIYTVETLENGYKIENEEGKLAYFIHDAENDSWSSVVDGVETKLLKFEKGNIATVFLPNGQEKEVELSQDGVLAFEQYMDNKTFYAAY